MKKSKKLRFLILRNINTSEKNKKHGKNKEKNEKGFGVACEAHVQT